MNCIDVVFFQAAIAPDKLALVADGSVIPYGRLARGILSAQQRLTAIGLTEGQAVGIHVAHPIDHLVLAGALYRMKVATASITNALDVYLDHVALDMVLSDNILPTLSTKQPASKFVLVDPSWFQDQTSYGVAQRSSSRRDSALDWVSRITCYPDNRNGPAVVKTTSQSLEGQLLSYCLSAPPNWERMISVAGLQSNSGFLQALSALWLGRSVCFGDMQNARNLISLYKHDYLVAPADDVEALLKVQETQFNALHGLRAACFEGRACRKTTLARGLSTISSNLLFRYTHPEIGIVAYGDVNRFKNIEGAAGFVAPWVEAQIVDDDGKSLGREKEGAFRFRLRHGGLSITAQGYQDPNKGWINPRQRAKIMSNNLLVLGPAGTNI